MAHLIKNSETFNLNSYFPYQLSVLAQQVTDFIAQIYKLYGLTKMEWRVLATVGYHGEISAKNICTFTRLDKMQVSRAANKLVKNNLLKRLDSAVDRRESFLVLDAKGIETYQELIPAIQEQELRLLKRLSEQEQADLKHLVTKLSGLLDES